MLSTSYEFSKKDKCKRDDTKQICVLILTFSFRPFLCFTFSEKQNLCATNTDL